MSLPLGKYSFQLQTMERVILLRCEALQCPESERSEATSTRARCLHGAQLGKKRERRVDVLLKYKKSMYSR